MKKLSFLVSSRFILVCLTAFTLSIVAESCEKHACGSMAQKRARNNRIKKSTSFMTY